MAKAKAQKKTGKKAVGKGNLVPRKKKRRKTSLKNIA